MSPTQNANDRTLLLTGGTGFIGRFLVPELLVRGWNVTVLSRQKPSEVHKILGQVVSCVPSLADITDDEVFDACINLAGEGIINQRWTSARKKELYKSRIGLTRGLVALFGRQDKVPDVLVSGSAVGYYGPEEAINPLDEQDGAGRDFPARLCLDWELEAIRASAFIPRVCLLRTGIVLHPQFGALKKMLPAFRFCAGGPVGNGHQCMSWIHIKDMVRVILFALDNSSIDGPVNAVAPNPVTNEYFSKHLATSLHRPCFLRMPETVVKLMFGEASCLLLEGQKIMPTTLHNHGFSFLFPDIDSCLQDFFSA